MTNEELLDKIKAEIERQMKYYEEKEMKAWDDSEQGDEDALWYQGHRKMCAKLLSFLSTLEEQTKEVHNPIFDECVAKVDPEVREEVERNIDQMLEDDRLIDEIKNFIEEYGYERGEDKLLIAIVARHFYELGCRRTAEKYDEIEYNRQREETAYDTRQYTPRPSVDIEDVARVQFASHAKVFDKKRKAVFDWEQFKEVAGIFYGFGKKDLEPEKPVPNDLQEYASRAGFDYVDNIVQEHPGHRFNDHDVEYAYRDGIIAGAKWQAERLLSGRPLPEDTVLFNKGVEEGKRLMMEEAVEGEFLYTPYPTIDLADWEDYNFKDFDKVRVIVIPNTDEK